MLIHLEDTDSSAIAKQLGTQVTTGRVLTLIVVCSPDDDIDCLITATNDASREHPSRVLMLVADPEAETAGVDADIHLGGDSGASELVVMHLRGDVARHLDAVVRPLLLPDTPVVAWWPAAAPIDPAVDPIGALAQCRITDALFDPPVDSIYRRRNNYTPGDSDMSWSRITPWRGVVAATMDQPPHEEIIDGRVFGPADSPSVDLAAGWLADRLGVNIVRESTGQPAIPVDDEGNPCIAITKVEIMRTSSTITIEVADATTLSVQMPGRPPALVALSRRSQSDCLAEELRHLDPDRAYGRALRGLSRVRYVDTFSAQ